MSEQIVFITQNNGEEVRKEIVLSYGGGQETQVFVNSVAGDQYSLV